MTTGPTQRRYDGVEHDACMLTESQAHEKRKAALQSLWTLSFTRHMLSQAHIGMRHGQRTVCQGRLRGLIRIQLSLSRKLFAPVATGNRS